MKVSRRYLVFAVVVGLALLLVGTGCAFTLGERNPSPVVNVMGKNLKLAFKIGKKVPDEFVIKAGMSKATFTEQHKTLNNAFDNAFENVAVQDPGQSNLILELTSLEIRREQLANIGSTMSCKYKAVLKLTATGEVLRTAAGTAYPKNPMVGDWKAIFDDGIETMFEDISYQIFAGGNFVLPEVPDRDAPESDEEKPQA